MFNIIIRKHNSTEEVVSFEVYQEALDSYRKIKENIAPGVEEIEFVKVTDDVISSIFKKKFKTIEFPVEEVVETQVIKNSKELASNLKSLLDEIHDIKKHHEVTIKVSERKRELNLHTINSFDSDKFSSIEELNNYKIKMFDDLYYWENERRNSKTELHNINNIEKCLGNINLGGMFNLKESDKTRFDKDFYEKTVSFTDNNDKDNIIRNNKTYAYYLVDYLKKEIYFYNKFDSGKSIQELKTVTKNQVKLAVNDVSTNTNNNVKTNTNDIEFDDVKEFKFRTIKEKAHILNQHKSKYKHNAICDARQIIYFSNSPIDIDIM